MVNIVLVLRFLEDGIRAPLSRTAQSLPARQADAAGKGLRVRRVCSRRLRGLGRRRRQGVVRRVSGGFGNDGPLGVRAAAMPVQRT